MDEIVRLIGPEKVFVTVTRKSEDKRSRMVCLEKMSVLWIQDLVDKFSKTGELIVDLLFGMFATAKSCSKFPQSRPSVVCKGDVDCFATSTKALFHIYERQILNGKSNISGTDEVMDVCKVVV